MQKDYYQILNLTPNCTSTELADSFRRLSLRWHPKKAKEDEETSNYHFAEVCEAYDVLSDPVKRAYFDRYGWKKFTEDYFKDSGMNAGWKFGKNSEEIFDNFFKSTKVVDQLVDRQINNKGSIFSNAFGSLNQTEIIKTPNLHITVPCTLSELYKGEAKIVKFQKHILGLDGCSIELREVEKIIEIMPGCSEGVTLLFPGEGTQSISFPPSDLIFKITQIPHSLYTRSGNNLIYTSKITLSDAISCAPLEIITLDNRKLRVSLDEIPTPHEVKEVTGEGMPIKGTKNKGDLFIKFDIIFPRELGQETRVELRKLLS